LLEDSAKEGGRGDEKVKGGLRGSPSNLRRVFFYYMINVIDVF